MKEGDEIGVNIDYYNSEVTFYKNDPEEEDGELTYSMPIKLDLGPVYPFVSLSTKDSQVSIVEEIPLLMIE